MELRVTELNSLSKGTVVRYPSNLGQADAPTEWAMVAVSANDEAERFRGLLFLEGDHRFVPLHPDLPVISTGMYLKASAQASSIRLIQGTPNHHANALIVNGAFVGFYVPVLGDTMNMQREVFVTLDGVVESTQTAIVAPGQALSRRCYGIVDEWEISLGDAPAIVASFGDE